MAMPALPAARKTVTAPLDHQPRRTARPPRLPRSPEVRASAPTFTALAFAPSGILYAIEGGFGGTKWNLVTLGLTASGGNVPTISSLTNAASSITPGLPNAGIAPGAIFVVYGTNLGPAKIAYAPAALPEHNVKRYVDRSRRR